VPTMVGTNTDWAGISAGAFHSLGLKTDGTLWSWGRNNFGQLGLGLGQADGIELFNTNRPARVGTGADWSAIEAGNFHSFAINSAGGLFGWGANFFGQLGNGLMGSTAATNSENKVSPVAIAADKFWRSVDASSHSLGVTVDGNVWGWGWNGNGQVGDRTGGDGTRNNNRSLPVLLSFNADTNIVATNPPVITQQPANQVINEGAAVAFTLAAGGTPTLFYQWYFNSNAIASSVNPSATNATLFLSSGTGANAGFYHAVVTNTFGQATSTAAKLTVGITNGAPIIVQGPTNTAALTNTTATFSVTVVGAAPFFYQWRFNISIPAGTGVTTTANSSTLTLSNVTSANQGVYDVIITNIFGAVTSTPAAILFVTNSSTGLPGLPLAAVGAGNNLRIESITFDSNVVAIAVTGGASHKTLVLEYKDALSETDWMALSTNGGTATILIDPKPPLDRSRYYRVRAK
jgi:hypothetical protein